MMTGLLIERGGKRHGQIYPLTAAVTTIGRGQDNDIVVADAYISAHHAQVSWEAERYAVQDCGSTNGTYFNGERLTTPQALHGGDRIVLPGEPGVTLVFDNSARTVELPVRRRAAATYQIDHAAAELWVHGTRAPLTAKEYRALLLLHERNGALVSKEELAAHVWPEYQGMVADCNVEQLIARLRRKLAGETAQPSPLVTVRGLGYRLIVS